MYKAIRFDKLVPGAVTIDNFHGVRINLYGERTLDIKGKVMYLPLDNKTRTPQEMVRDKNRSSRVVPKTGQTLYICKESHIPRKLLRNSDYKITINRDNADSVVVPTPSDEDVATRKYNILYIVTGATTSVYYFVLNYNFGHTDDEADPDDVQKIKDAIKKRIYVAENESADFFCYDNLNVSTMYFLKKCQEIEDILTGAIYDEETKRDRYKIAIDTQIRLEPTNEIDMEMLQIWEKMDDLNMLCKLIIGSNWQKYPCTISAFLGDSSVKYYGGEQMRYIKESLDFSYYNEYGRFRPNREVQPEDWNLLQNWLMVKAGVGENGGFKRKERSSPMNLVHYAEVYKPCKITEPTLFQEIEARLKN